jgi:CTP synthase
MREWREMVDRIYHPKDEITIHFVGKYVEYEDSYKSINEALRHGGFKHRVRVKLHWVEAEALEDAAGLEHLQGAHGILVGPGFGGRGSRGMMRAAEFARVNNIPYFGICYGFQWAVVEFARHVAGLTDADSTEVVEDTPSKVIYKLRDLLGVDDMGGTMRLGTYACKLAPGSRARQLYGEDVIHERHRHRYEFNAMYEPALVERGLQVVGRSLDGKFVEIVELPDHPWFVAVQFHPEFKSKPLRPHALFAGFVEAAYQHQVAHKPASAKLAAS